MGRWDRPELQKALGQLREGDVLVVWNLERLSRSLKDLLHIMQQVHDAGAGLRSLTEAGHTTGESHKVGKILVAQGKFQEALDAYQEDLKIRQRLAEQDKSNAGSQLSGPEKRKWRSLGKRRSKIGLQRVSQGVRYPDPVNFPSFASD